MYLKYGAYQHTNNEASVVIDRRANVSPNGVVQSVRHRWQISGRIHAADQTVLTSALRSLEAAYGVQGQDIGLYLDDGTLTHVLRNADTIGGTRIVGPVSYPDGRGAEYSTFRNYTVAIEGDVSDNSAGIISWQETLEFSGGGPMFGFLQPLTGLPQKQLLVQNTTYRATQSGSATGSGSYPLVPSPLWPNDEHPHLRRIRWDSPRRAGRFGGLVFTEFPVSWSYSFECMLPLFGVPTPPPSS